MKEVEIQSKKLIKPATPTPSHLHTLNISSIDQLLPPFFIPVIFYFNHHHHQIMLQTTHTLQLLQESLSKVLTLYYPFAGRYNKDESTICCEDQGAEFVVASVNHSLDELVQGEYDHLVIATVHASPFTSTTPLLSVQVNEFSCGGLAIGVGLMHKLGDMFTFSKFMDAWATACRLGTSDQLPLPNFTLSSFLPPKSIKPPPPSSSAPTTPPPPNYIMKRYTFTGEAISNLKSQLDPSSSDYTRVVLVTALITRSLINVECSKPGIRATHFLLCHNMNMRSRTTLPIPDNSSGNFTMMVLAARQVENNESRELQEVAQFVRNSLRDAAYEIGKVGDWGEIGRMAAGAFLKFRQPKENVNRVIFSSWCNFGLNDVNFGWGKPSLVSTVKGPINLVDLMDYCSISGDTRGIDAWVCLKEDDMARFRQEPDILEYAISF